MRILPTGLQTILVAMVSASVAERLPKDNGLDGIPNDANVDHIWDYRRNNGTVQEFEIRNESKPGWLCSTTWRLPP